jgi:hypothetical protein
MYLAGTRRLPERSGEPGKVQDDQAFLVHLFLNDRLFNDNFPRQFNSPRAGSAGKEGRTGALGPMIAMARSTGLIGAAIIDKATGHKAGRCRDQ